MRHSRLKEVGAKLRRLPEQLVSGQGEEHTSCLFLCLAPSRQPIAEHVASRRAGDASVVFGFRQRVLRGDPSLQAFALYAIFDQTNKIGRAHV